MGSQIPIGAEPERINCQFYVKIGSCRHGDRCSRRHTRPNWSPTILCPNMYILPDLACVDQKAKPLSKQEALEDYEAFYEDFYCEAAKFGPVEEVIICENTNDHLTGNVYCRFRHERDAKRCKESFDKRWYRDRPIYCEMSPVVDFRDACCRLHDRGECDRGSVCNFIHAKRPRPELLKDLELSQRAYLRGLGGY